jgi:hypothetical protein
VEGEGVEGGRKREIERMRKGGGEEKERVVYQN